MASPTTASGSVAIGPTPLARLFASINYLLLRRRIFLSFLLFGGLLVVDIGAGVRPHDLADPRDPVTVAGVVLVLCGLALRSWAAGILKKDEVLTTSGPYRLMRNPLYLGSFMMMFGFCALINDPISILVILGPILFIYLLKVRSEERWLAGLFPAQWAAYERSTPRFLPRIGRTDVLASWSAKQWIRAREYQAIGATLAAFAAIKIWREIG